MIRIISSGETDVLILRRVSVYSSMYSVFIHHIHIIHFTILVACLNYRTSFSEKGLSHIFQETAVNCVQSWTEAWNTVTAVPDQTGHEPLFRACALLR